MLSGTQLLFFSGRRPHGSLVEGQTPFRTCWTCFCCSSLTQAFGQRWREYSIQVQFVLGRSTCGAKRFAMDRARKAEKHGKVSRQVELAPWYYAARDGGTTRHGPLSVPRKPHVVQQCASCCVTKIHLPPLSRLARRRLAPPTPKTAAPGSCCCWLFLLFRSQLIVVPVSSLSLQISVLVN